MNIPIIYEDDRLLIVDKPAGLLTIPAKGKESRTLSSVLNEDLKQKGIFFRLHPCHRLDRETSGLIIYAKGKSVQKMMMQLFKRKEVKKTYIAFVRGELSKAQGEIDNPIDGQSALTRYWLLKKMSGFSIVKIMPLTGRKNQIRIHFKQLGFPILGETKYAFRRDFKVKAKRLCLHAEAIEFVHPVTKKYLRLVCPLEKDLQVFLKNMKTFPAA